MIVLDDVSKRELALARTPHLDALAARGLRLEGFYVTPVCSPSRATALTGLLPYRTGIGSPIGPKEPADRRLDPALETLPRFLHSLGWRTGAFGKHHLTSARAPEPLDHPAALGFDHFDGTLWNPGQPGPGNHYDYQRVRDGVLQEHETTYTSRAWTDAALEYLVADTARRSFVWLAYSAAHSPYDPPPGCEDSPDDREDFLHAIEYVDSEIGRLVAGLGDEGLEDTLLVVFADNGTPRTVALPGDRDRVKPTIYEGSINVPCILAGWRTVHGAVAPGNLLIGVQDLFATLAEAAAGDGATLPAQALLDGRSFLSVILGEPLAEPRSSIVTQRFDERNDLRAAIHATGWKAQFVNGLTRFFRLPDEEQEVDPGVIPADVRRELEEQLSAVAP